MRHETYTDLEALQPALATLKPNDTASVSADLLDKRAAICLAAKYDCWPMKDGGFFTFERLPYPGEIEHGR